MTSTLTASYPKELERTVTLRSGDRIRIRPIRPDDEPRLSALYDRLSLTTAYQRFFTRMKRLPPQWAHFFANVDYHDRLAIVAETGDESAPTLVGVARYEPSDDAGAAEIAIVVEDAWQGRGLGAVLLRELIAAGEARGVQRFIAYVLAENRRMLHLLSQHTETVRAKTHQGVTELEFRGGWAE